MGEGGREGQERVSGLGIGAGVREGCMVWSLCQAFGTHFAAAEERWRTENGALVMHGRGRREHLEELV